MKLNIVQKKFGFFLVFPYIYFEKILILTGGSYTFLMLLVIWNIVKLYYLSLIHILSGRRHGCGKRAEMQQVYF